jgi:toxin ParE1/3/4
MKLRWSRLAVADLDSAYSYVAAEDPAAAERLIDRIEKAAAVLGRHPAAGRDGRVAATRELVIAGTPFIPVYRIRKGGLEILAVIHGSRKWPETF